MEKRFAINERGLRIGEDHQNARYTNGEVDMVHQLRDNGWSIRFILWDRSTRSQKLKRKTKSNFWHLHRFIIELAV